MSRALLAALLALLAPAPASAATTFFQSPSRNIGCVIERSSGVRCDIRARSWRPPPRPDSCPVDWASGVTLSRSGRASFTCAGDTVLGMGRPLPYGRTITRGRFRCTSRRTGMRCRNRRSGHGFRLSRARVRRY